LCGKFKQDERAANVARVGKSNNAHKILMGKPSGKRPLGNCNFRSGIILKCFKETVGGYGEDLSALENGEFAGCWEQGEGP
jgi:hypothetical protein